MGGDNGVPWRTIAVFSSTAALGLYMYVRRLRIELNDARGTHSKKWKKLGALETGKVVARLPFCLQPSAYKMSVAVAIKSDDLDKYVAEGLKRRVEGLEKWGTTFMDITNLIFKNGDTMWGGFSTARVYVYGGFVRDAIQGSVAEDMDMLFTCSVDSLKAAADDQGWPVKMKRDEKSGKSRNDFIAIGDADAKQKFSGHPVGSGCEGEFACNTLMYEVETGVLVDPTGYGMQDAAQKILRCPYPQDMWELWVTEDRLLGMKLVRYFNFKGRGYQPSDTKFETFVMDKLATLLESDQDKEAMQQTLLTFFKRKIFIKSKDIALKKEGAYRSTVVTTFDASASNNTQMSGSTWYKMHIQPLYLKVEKAQMQKYEGLEQAVQYMCV